MPRPPSASWHKGANCWSSAVGDVGENGRRKPIYFREIPFGAKGSPNYRKAQDELRKYLDARDARKQRGLDHTIGDLSRLYLLWLKPRVEAGRTKASTYLSVLKALKKLRALTIAPGRLVRDQVAREFTATDLARLVEGLRDVGHKPNYIGRLVASLQAILNWAAKPLHGRDPEQLLDRNPVARFQHEATRAPQSADRFADDEEVAAFLKWGYARAEKLGGLAGRFERATFNLIEVASLTGARPGELRIAEWPDFEAKAVFIAELGEWWGRIKLDPTRWKSGAKTGKAREIFLPPVAVAIVEALAANPDRHPRFVFTHKRGMQANARGATNPQHGEVWSPSALPNKICHLRRRAILDGVPLIDQGENRFVMYRLRHTAAAKLLMAGVDVGTVARLLGTSTGMIETTYGSYTSDHLAKAASRGLGRMTPPSENPSSKEIG